MELLSDHSSVRSKNVLTLNKLAMGDLVKAGGNICSPHWGVYTGKEIIVNLTGQDGSQSVGTGSLFSVAGTSFRRAKVSSVNFWTFAGRHEVKISNTLDGTKRPLSTLEIITNAESKIGEVIYSDQTKSCEHFAKWCRYGDQQQADGASSGLSGMFYLAAGMFTLGLGAYGAYKVLTGGDKEETKAKSRASSSSGFGSIPSNTTRDFAAYDPGVDDDLTSSSSDEEAEEIRCFGRFRCPSCHTTWDSSYVYVDPKTSEAEYGQSCKRCGNNWVLPYKIEPLKCTDCFNSPCTCKCANCRKLKKKPPKNRMPKSGNGSKYNHYCKCDKESRYGLGDHIDRRKPHRSDLCERCRFGLPCAQRD